MVTGAVLLVAIAVAITLANWKLRRVVISRYMASFHIEWDEAAHLADQEHWWLRTTWRENVRHLFDRRAQ